MGVETSGGVDQQEVPRLELDFEQLNEFKKSLEVEVNRALVRLQVEAVERGEIHFTWKLEDRSADTLFLQRTLEQVPGMNDVDRARDDLLERFYRCSYAAPFLPRDGFAFTGAFLSLGAGLGTLAASYVDSRDVQVHVVLVSVLVSMAASIFFLFRQEYAEFFGRRRKRCAVRSEADKFLIRNQHLSDDIGQKMECFLEDLLKFQEFRENADKTKNPDEYLSMLHASAKSLKNAAESIDRDIRDHLAREAHVEKMEDPLAASLRDFSSRLEAQWVVPERGRQGDDLDELSGKMRLSEDQDVENVTVSATVPVNIKKS